MLDLTNVTNIDINKVENTLFDIGIFASGFESRSSFLARRLKPEMVRHKVVLGFEESQEEQSRKINDAFYRDNYCDIFLISSQEEKKLYSKLLEIFEKVSDIKKLSILIDYTSMSRLWYAGILNFLRFQTNKEINVFLNYSLGKYDDNNFLDYSYSSINSLPSHEGSLSSNNKTLLVLAIGFSPYLIKSVIEEIEPNKIIGILPIPNIKSDYEKKSRLIKDDILTKDIDDWFRCPIDNLETIFTTYAEITNNNINNMDIIFLSLGPKIFTIASLLVSQRFEQVTCLYLKSAKTNIKDIQATGDFICNKISYKP
jgi:hypothetical protein